MNVERVIDPKNFAPFAKNPCISKFFIQLGRVDELGSGVINVNRIIKEYTHGGKARFIEGNTFKIIIPITNEGLSEGLSEGLNEGLNEGLKSVLLLIESNPGIQANAISVLLGNRPLKTIERQIKTLVEKGMIERIGSKKTGGYHTINNAE